MTPYTYLIRHNPSGKVYYGCRYAKGCKPSELWVSYFTSSKVVRSLIQSDGKSSFSCEVRRTFDSIEECRNWEHRVLKRMRVVARKIFLNLTDNKSIDPVRASVGPKNRSMETNLRMAKVAERMGKSNRGKKRSEEFRDSVRERMKGNSFAKGRTDSPETRAKKRQSKLGKPSNAVGNYQPVCSCIICKKQLTSSTIKNHFNFNHTNV